MSLDDYNWGMTEMLNDKYYMNNSMIKDAYFLGIVLAKNTGISALLIIFSCMD
ncbi:MAG: hypothetical protein IPI68_09305 [Chitinophagaceae bacterium]|nr:hypothetical protein [Chitinophagaceae bacterium]